LPSIKEFINLRIFEDHICEPNFKLNETESTASAGSLDILSLSLGYKTNPKYKILRSEDSEIDDYSLLDYVSADASY
jgi:hypothetical protein